MLVLFLCGIQNNKFFLILGNLISIGPGLYESNHTLDGATRGIYVLGSCEFMHDGKLETISFYVASSDWLSLQIWRPTGGHLPMGKLQLVYEKNVDIVQPSGKYEVSNMSTPTKSALNAMDQWLLSKEILQISLTELYESVVI